MKTPLSFPLRVEDRWRFFYTPVSARAADAVFLNWTAKQKAEKSGLKRLLIGMGRYALRRYLITEFPLLRNKDIISGKAVSFGILKMGEAYITHPPK